MIPEERLWQIFAKMGHPWCCGNYHSESVVFPCYDCSSKEACKDMKVMGLFALYSEIDGPLCFGTYHVGLYLCQSCPAKRNCLRATFPLDDEVAVLYVPVKYRGASGGDLPETKDGN